MPLIHAVSPPLAGNPNFTVSVSGAIGNASAVLVIDSVDPGVGTSIPTSGAFARLSTSTNNTGAGNGWASLSMPVPNTTPFVGQTFFARWYVLDPGAANGFSVSQVAQFTVFGQAIAASNATISGQVVDPAGRGFRATVNLTGPGGTNRTATTSTFGFYTFENVPTGVTYSLTVSSRRFRFPRIDDLLITSNLTDVNFLGQE